MKLKECPICHNSYKQLIKHSKSHTEVTTAKFISLYLGLDEIPKCVICNERECKMDTHHLCFSRYCYECGGFGSNFRHQSYEDWQRIHPNQSEISSNTLKKLWSDPSYRNKMWQIGSQTMSRQFDDFEFIYRKYITSYKYVDENSESYVYLVDRFGEVKVGFTYNLGFRLKELGYPKLIQVIKFPNIRSGLYFEFKFHQLNKSKMIRNEYYPTSLLRIFESQFITYNQFMI